MGANRVTLQSKRIVDWESFHDVFAEIMGFPAFYGRNMDAWIDCMGYIDDVTAAMTRVHIAPGEMLHLEIADTEDFRRRVPEIFSELIDCLAFVNHRSVESGGQPILSLVLI